MPRHHVREEADGEGERLGEQAEEFDDEHQGPERCRHAGGNEVGPISDGSLRAHARDLREHEGEQRQDHGDGDVAGRRRDPRKTVVGGDGKQPAQVHEEDEEERRAEIRGVKVRVVTDVLHRNLVPDEHHERLQQVVTARRDHRALAGAQAHDDQQDAGGDPHVDDVLGDVQPDVAVPRPEPERDHHFVLHVLEDVLGDPALVLLAALSVLALPLGARRNLLVAERRPVLVRGRMRRVGHRHFLALLPGPCLREQKSGEKDDHGVAPCGRELACTNSTSITCVAA